MFLWGYYKLLSKAAHVLLLLTDSATEMGRDEIYWGLQLEVIIKKKKKNNLPSNIGVHGLILSGRICFPCLPCSSSNITRDWSHVLQTRIWAAVTIRYSLAACSLLCHTAFSQALPWQGQEFLWYLHWQHPPWTSPAMQKQSCLASQCKHDEPHSAVGSIGSLIFCEH